MSWRSMGPALSNAACKCRAKTAVKTINSVASGVPQICDKLFCGAVVRIHDRPKEHRCTTVHCTLKMENGRDCVGEKLAPFNPSGDEVIRMAIEMLQIVQEDVVYDFGCGDGRFLVEAVKSSGARGVLGVLQVLGRGNCFEDVARLSLMSRRTAEASFHTSCHHFPLNLWDAWVCLPKDGDLD